MNSKKAVAHTSEYLVGIIIVLVSFGIALYLVSQAAPEEETISEAACHTSVATRAAFTINLKEGVIRSPLGCKTIPKPIEEDKQETMKQLADAMARCWWMFNEGKYEEILREGISGILPEFKTKNDCFVCYAVTLKPNSEFKEGEKITLEEMQEFIMAEENKYENADKNYLDYIQTNGRGRVLIFGRTGKEKDSGETFTLKSGSAYGISFASKNPKTTFEEVVGKLKGIGEGAIMIVIGGVLVKTKVGAFIGKPLVMGGVGLIVLEAGFLGEDIIKTLMTERDVSSIYLTDLKTAQQYCFEGNANIDVD